MFFYVFNDGRPKALWPMVLFPKKFGSFGVNIEEIAAGGFSRWFIYKVAVALGWHCSVR